MDQNVTNIENAQFWQELCGSGLARSIGITDASPESLRRFDEAYFTFYPYLKRYVLDERVKNKKVLEIGLGYGTLGQLLAAAGCNYYGLDISKGPVAMMQHRLAQLGLEQTEEWVSVGSALNILHRDDTFDYVYSIGCLHHTGNLKQAVAEVHRVLAPGGKAIVMLYNRYSFRQLVRGSQIRLRYGLSMANRDRELRALYDTNQEGEAAPHTDFVSRGEVKQLFEQFAHVKIDIQNFDDCRVKGIRIPRTRLLNNVARRLGLDLYITATK